MFQEVLDILQYGLRSGSSDSLILLGSRIVGHRLLLIARPRVLFRRERKESKTEVWSLK